MSTAYPEGIYPAVRPGATVVPAAGATYFAGEVRAAPSANVLIEHIP